ncbi:high light inducible protein [Synechococcus sp. BIOS-E4-1]|nr:high light inducible protein [Synechococcus sp. BIOS-E4-1]QNI56234.1 high light inducible protein [Synechococcus sp. BIOS-E4-1]
MRTSTQNRFGSSRFAEILNARLAMLSYVIGLVIELITGLGILSQIGFNHDC